MKEKIEAVICSDHKTVILCKQRSDQVIEVISSFTRSGCSIVSGIRMSDVRAHRIQRIVDIIPVISTMGTANGEVFFDCIRPVADNTDIFKENCNSDNGVIHFEMHFSEVASNGTKTTICDIDPKMIIGNGKLLPEENVKIRCKPFITDTTKLFTTILNRGYILSIVNSKTTTLLFTMNNPKKHIVGRCRGYNKMLDGIKLTWPIFRFQEDNNKNIKITLRNKTLDLSQFDKPILIKLSRNLRSNNATLSYLGEATYTM